jgi:hypothetical protein
MARHLNAHVHDWIAAGIVVVVVIFGMRMLFGQTSLAPLLDVKSLLKS